MILSFETGYRLLSKYTARKPPFFATAGREFAVIKTPGLRCMDQPDDVVNIGEATGIQFWTPIFSAATSVIYAEQTRKFDRGFVGTLFSSHLCLWTLTRKPCCRNESARYRTCSFSVWSSPTTFTTSLRVAKLRKPGFRDGHSSIKVIYE